MARFAPSASKRSSTGISAARTLAQKHDYRIAPRTELLGLGVANLAVAFAQGYPVAGGLSQSVVNDKAGAKTPMALIFASATLALCLLFLTGLLTNLPNVVLAAIVLVAVRGLIESQLPELRQRLEAAGVNVQRFDVSTDPGAGGRNPYRDAPPEYFPRAPLATGTPAAPRARIGRPDSGSLDVTV